jgi:hypothetical protein
MAAFIRRGVAGDLQVFPAPNTLHFTSVWRGWPSATRHRAEISNDIDQYKALMIVGNYSALRYAWLGASLVCYSFPVRDFHS